MFSICISEYAGNIGDADSEEKGEAEKQRLLTLINRFWMKDYLIEHEE